jgi:trans-aconitate methyltransferase
VRPVTARPEDSSARRAHWDAVYVDKAVDAVSWWQPVPEVSMRLVEAAGLLSTDPVIDVGAGCSTLTDHLLRRGYQNLTAVDLSATALTTLRERLGVVGAAVSFVTEDVLGLDLGRRYALWHDRAVFHFLTEPDQRDLYRAAVDRTLVPDGWLVVATFAPDGPTTCSGLPVRRYSADELAAEFPGFQLVEHTRDEHLTPWATLQPFTAALLRRRSTRALNLDGRESSALTNDQ